MLTIQIDGNGQLVSASEKSCHIKSSVYSGDGLNLLVSTQDSNGMQVYNYYEPGTSKLTRQEIYDNGNLKSKTDYLYNDKGIKLESHKGDFFDGLYDGTSKVKS